MIHPENGLNIFSSDSFILRSHLYFFISLTLFYENKSNWIFEQLHVLPTRVLPKMISLQRMARPCLSLSLCIQLTYFWNCLIELFANTIHANIHRYGERERWKFIWNVIFCLNSLYVWGNGWWINGRTSTITKEDFFILWVLPFYFCWLQLNLKCNHEKCLHFLQLRFHVQLSVHIIRTGWMCVSPKSFFLPISLNFCY